MAININATIYGSENEWLSIPDYYVKLATLNSQLELPYYKHTLGGGRMNGTVSDSGIDTSICPIAVDTACSMTNVKYVTLNAQNEIYEYITTPDVEPLVFVSTARGTNSQTVCNPTVVTSETASANNAWTSSKTGTFFGMSEFPLVLTSATQPIAEWEYKNVALLICVSCTDNNVNPTSFHYYDLHSYLESGNASYPYVVCVWAVPYCVSKLGGWKTFVSTSSDTSTFTLKSDQTSATFGVIPIGNSNSVITEANHSYNFIYKKHAYRDVECQTIFPDSPSLRTFTSQGIYAIVGGCELDGINTTIQKPLSDNYLPIYGYDRFILGRFQNSVGSERFFAYWDVVDKNDFKEWCLKQTSYFGMYFTDRYYNFTSNVEDFYSDDHTYMGLIDESGITHGTYAQGKEIANYEQSTWDSLKNQSPYDYTKRPDESVYDEETKLVGNTKAGTAFLHVYECDYATINSLKKFLYQKIAPQSTTESLTQNFLTVNPIDCITGCFEFPFSIRDRFSTPSNIVLGNTTATGVDDESPIVGYAFENTLRILDFGSIYYYPFYSDFRDYEPYSEALLYIPYVGFSPISPSEFMGHDIGIKMICDLLTGSCQALVYKDGLVIESLSGNIGTQVPITGIQQADYSNAIHSASSQLLSTQISSMSAFSSTIGSLISGDLGNVVGSVGNLAQSGVAISNAKYELQHTQVPFKMSGTASPNVNFSNEQGARLIIKRPQMLDGYSPSQYGHTVGFACLLTAPLSQFSGFTQATNADLSGISATVTEKQLIQQLLQSGVYL